MKIWAGFRAPCAARRSAAVKAAAARSPARREPHAGLDGENDVGTEFLVDTFAVVDPATRNPQPNITARELLDRAAASLETETSRSHEVLRRVAATMSRAYAGIGMPVPARNLAERAVREIEAASSADSSELAEALAALTRVSSLELDFTQARALGIYERLTGPRSPDVARALVSLVETYQLVDAREEHVRAAERAVSILRETRGMRALETVDAVAMLALAYRYTGKSEQSIALAQEARDAYVVLLGPAHLKIANVLFTLAVVNFELGRYREALAFGKEELATMTAALGPDDPRLARPHRLLQNNYEKLGDTPNALRSVKTAIAIIEKSPHPNLGHLHTAYGNFGKLLMDHGFLEAAELKFRREAELITQVFGPDHSAHAYNHYLPFLTMSSEVRVLRI